jgi:hypothetical protein
MSKFIDSLKARKDQKDLDRFGVLASMYANRQAAAVDLPIPAMERYNALLYKVEYEATSSSDLLRFYATVPEPFSFYGRQNRFYVAARGSDIPFCHYSLGQVITKTMEDLVFGKDISYKVSTGNRERDDDYQKALDEFWDDNDKMGFLRHCADLESYSGAVGIKFALDSGVSAFPIMQAYPKEQMEVIRKYGRIVEVTFKDYYPGTDPTRSLVLLTICGKGYIRYAAQYERVMAGLMEKTVEPAKLEDIPEAAGLHDTYFFNKDGTPSDRIFAIYKENKMGARSDYYEVLDDFDSIDEIYSNMMDAIRKSKIKTYLHDNAMLKTKGVNGVSSPTIPNAYDTSNIAIPDSNPNWAQTEIKRDVVPVQPLVDGYAAAFRHVLETALATAGLSINTVASSDMDSDYQNTMAVSSKEKSSIRTRDEKISRWKSAIASICSIAIGLMSASGDGNITIGEDADDKDFLAIFPDYEETPIRDKIALIIEKLGAGLMTREQAINELYPDMTDSQREELLGKLEAEKAERQAESQPEKPSDTSGTKQIVGVAKPK